MTFDALYRASFYVMLTLGTLTMSIDASGDNKLAMLYPPAVAVAGAMAFLTVDRNPKLGLSRTMAIALWGIGTGFMYLELRITDQLLLALGHWLVYHQLIKTFSVKSIEDDWLLFGVSLMQVLVGTVISQSDVVGMCLLAWAVSALWVLGLFYLSREANRHRQAPGVTVSPATSRETPYPGLIDSAFVLASLRVAAITMALGGVIFLAMPRSRATGMNVKGGPLPKHLTGFGDEVQLGQLGEILENDSVVMSIELFDGDHHRTEPPIDPLWRGVSMGRYEGGRWHRNRARSKGLSSEPRRRTPSSQIILQQIKLEPTDTTVLFGLRPVLDADADGRIPPEISSVDGSLHRPDPRSGNYDYKVWSHADPKFVQPYEGYPSFERAQLLLQVPEEMRAKLREIADPLIASIPAQDIQSRAQALTSYLRDNPAFSYTLQMDVEDPTVDPVIDFLVNRKRGHCAYYASALTLLLRSVGIPARMINGFRGGDWNDLAGVLTVREKHAHSWVEALVGQVVEDEFGREPVWITLDPTPSLQRDAIVAKVGGVPPRFRALSDFVRYVWVFYVAGYDAERQQRLIYEPVMNLVAQAKRGFQTMGTAVKEFLKRPWKLPDIAWFFSVGGFLVTFFALLFLTLLFWLLRRLVRLLLRWFRGSPDEAALLSAGVAFYRRLALVLAEIGLERPAPETPREFARRASGFLNGRGPDAGPVVEIPAQVVDAYYAIRFGQHDLPAATIRELEGKLDALEASLKA